jgi:hypothetical protein
MEPALMMQTATGLLAVSVAGGGHGSHTIQWSAASADLARPGSCRHRGLRIPAAGYCHMEGVTRVIHRNENWSNAK